MSHTTRVGKTVFIHNGDFSGDVELIVDKQQIQKWEHGERTVSVPFEEIKGLVAEYVRQKTLEAVHAADADELLFSMPVEIEL